MPRLNIEAIKSDTVPWLADQIFKAFPQDVTGLMFYIMDCGCIYFHRVFENGSLDFEIGIYRDAEGGAYEIYACFRQ